MKDIASGLLEAIRNGHSLESAMERSGGFSRLDILVTGVGERSAALGKVFRGIGMYYQEREALRREIIRAASYPLIVLLTAIGAMYVMAAWVIPVFSGIYEQNGAELPALTRGIMRTAGSLPMLSGISMGLLLSALMLHLSLRGKDRYALTLHRLLDRLPFLGNWRYTVAMERFCNMMSMMMQAGVTLSPALQMMASHDPSTARRQAYHDILIALAAGLDLHASLSSTGRYDAVLLQLLKAGESSGRLVSAFEQAAVHYRSRLRQITSIISTWLEPVLILFTGLIVGLMLIGLYMPIFEMGNMYSM